MKKVIKKSKILKTKNKIKKVSINDLMDLMLETKSEISGFKLEANNKFDILGTRFSFLENEISGIKNELKELRQDFDDFTILALREFKKEFNAKL